MEQFITLIVFTLPGVFTYILAKLFGTTPSHKRKGNEMVIISLLLWISIVIIILIIYQIAAGLSHWDLIHPAFDWPLVEKN